MWCQEKVLLQAVISIAEAGWEWQVCALAGDQLCCDGDSCGR